MVKLLSKIILVTVIAFGMMFLMSFTCSFTTATADEATEQTEEETEDTEDTKAKTTKMIDNFIALLKEKYGVDYQAEYDKIIAKWGSIESYLLSLADSDIVPDVAKDGFTAFVKWLGEYAPIWATFLAIIFAICLAVKSAKKQKKLDELSKDLKELAEKTAKIITAQNVLIEGQTTQLTVSKSQLGTNSKFESERQLVTETVEKLNQDI